MFSHSERRPRVPSGGSVAQKRTSQALGRASPQRFENLTIPRVFGELDERGNANATNTDKIAGWNGDFISRKKCSEQSYNKKRATNSERNLQTDSREHRTIHVADHPIAPQMSVSPRIAMIAAPMDIGPRSHPKATAMLKRKTAIPANINRKEAAPRRIGICACITGECIWTSR